MKKMKSVMPLFLLPLLLTACEKIGELFGGDGGSTVTPPEIRVVAVTDVMAYVEVEYYDETTGAEVGICWAEHPAPGTEQTIALSGPGTGLLPRPNITHAAMRAAGTVRRRSAARCSLRPTASGPK